MTAFARTTAWLPATQVGIAALAAWQAAVPAFGVAPVILVPPSAVLDVLGQRSAILWQHAAVTALEMLEGFAAAAALGIALAACIAGSRTVRGMVMPYLLILQIVPKIALAPLFIVWLGTGSTCRLAFAVFLGLFPVTVAGVAGLHSVDRDVLRLSAALRASRMQEVLLIRLPYALPHVFAGLKVAVTMVLLGVVIGEFVTAQAGLGYIILFASSIGETALVFAAIVLLCLIGLALYAAVAVAERAYGRWFGARLPDMR